MNDYLNKHWPTVVSVAFVIVLLVLASWLAHTNLPGQGLLFQLISKSPLEADDASPNPPMRVTIAGKDVTAPYLSTIIIRNTGNIPIMPEDFQTPVRITVINEAKIVQIYYEKKPADIDVAISYTQKEVSLAPTLLNPNDKLFLQIFTEGAKPELETGARIAGIKKVVTKEWETGTPWGEIGWAHFAFLFLGVFVFLALAGMLRMDCQGRYILITRKALSLLFVFNGLIAVYIYFSMLADHNTTIYASRLLLLALLIVAELAAWKFARDGGCSQE